MSENATMRWRETWASLPGTLTCCRTLSRGSALTTSSTVSPVSSLLWSVNSKVSGLTRHFWSFPTCEGSSGFHGLQRGNWWQIYSPALRKTKQNCLLKKHTHLNKRKCTLKHSIDNVVAKHLIVNKVHVEKLTCRPKRCVILFHFIFFSIRWSSTRLAC